MEKVSQKSLNEKLKKAYLEVIKLNLENNGEEILIVGSNEIAIPCVDANDNDSFVVVKVSVPTGSRDGEAYDGYAMAEDYAMKQAEKQEKAKAQAEAKAKKIERDKANREKLAKSKAKAKSE